jgi:hypothetical protein
MAPDKFEVVMTRQFFRDLSLSSWVRRALTTCGGRKEHQPEKEEGGQGKDRDFGRRGAEETEKRGQGEERKEDALAAHPRVPSRS